MRNLSLLIETQLLYCVSSRFYSFGFRDS